MKLARLSVIVVGFLGAAASLTGVFFTRDLTLVALLLSSGFFFAELVIGPIWSVPMDIAPKYAGTASGLMNTGSALAAIVSPIVFGFVVDKTGSWTLPFIGSIGCACSERSSPSRCIPSANSSIRRSSRPDGSRASGGGVSDGGR